MCTSQGKTAAWARQRQDDALRPHSPTLVEERTASAENQRLHQRATDRHHTKTQDRADSAAGEEGK
eukprot:1268911-Pyramimonas_sp.AAC.1